MPYTLAKWLLWYIAALLIGGWIGWVLRGRKARREVGRARAATADPIALERLRARVANLEPVVDERDRLRAELDECRAATSAAKSGLSGVAGLVSADREAPAIEPLAEEAPPATAEPQATGETQATGEPQVVVEPEPAALDLAAAAAVLGSKVKLDDLKVVEGIGPKIEELCHAKGITTWRGLASADVAALRAMLDEAGPRFAMHDPGSWPQQAELLAGGRWEDFKTLTDSLQAGRSAE